MPVGTKLPLKLTVRATRWKLAIGPVMPNALSPGTVMLVTLPIATEFGDDQN
jgi:hypothetical protein